MMKALLFRNRNLINVAASAAFSLNPNPIPKTSLLLLRPVSLSSSFVNKSIPSIPFNFFSSISCSSTSNLQNSSSTSSLTSSSSDDEDIKNLFEKTYEHEFYVYTDMHCHFCWNLEESTGYSKFLHEEVFLNGSLQNHHMDLLKNIYKERAYDLSNDCRQHSTRPYYEFCDDWSIQIQRTVSMVAFLHWLETGNLISLKEVETKFGIDLLLLEGYLIGFHVKDYLLGICLMCSKLPGYAEKQGEPSRIKVWKFLKIIQVLFERLDLRNFKDDDICLEKINAVRNGDYMRKVENGAFASDFTLSLHMLKLFEETYRNELFKYSEIGKGICLLMYSVRTVMVQMREDLFVREFFPVPGALEKSKSHIEKLKLHYRDLAQLRVDCKLSEWTRPYYEHMNEWTSQRQTAVYTLAFLHWLETGKLISCKEIESKLGLDSLQNLVSYDKEINSESGLGTLEGVVEFHLKDYLLGICLMSSKLPDYAEYKMNTDRDFNCPRKVLTFLKDIQALFKMLSLHHFVDDTCLEKLNAVIEGNDVRRAESICLKLDAVLEDNNKVVLDAAVNVPESMGNNNHHKSRMQKLQLVLIALISLL